MRRSHGEGKVRQRQSNRTFKGEGDGRSRERDEGERPPADPINQGAANEAAYQLASGDGHSEPDRLLDSANMGLHLPRGTKGGGMRGGAYDVSPGAWGQGSVQGWRHYST